MSTNPPSRVAPQRRQSPQHLLPSEPSLPLRSPQTLQDLVQQIRAMEHLALARRHDLISAVHRVADALGQKPADIVIDVAAIRTQLALIRPAMLGVTVRRWANVRSLFAAALQLADVPVIRRRPRAAMHEDWRTLLQRVPDRYDRSRLSRLAGYCSAAGVPPHQVDDALLQQFGADLLSGSLIPRAKQVYRESCLAWNKATETVPAWPEVRLAVPNHQTTYALPVTAYPPSFSADVTAYLQHRAGADIFSEMAAQPAAPATLKATRTLLLQIAGALVHTGRDPQSIHGLADLVKVEAAEAALGFIWTRSGRRITGHLHHHAMLLVKLAKHWVKVPADQLQRLQAMRKKLEPRKTGMTERNRAVLRQFVDPANVTRLLTLPDAIAQGLQADRVGGGAAVGNRSFGDGSTGGRSASASPGYQNAVLMQSALAIAILQVAPMRIKNLASLRLDQHLARGHNSAVCTIVLPPAEVKNGVAMEFELPDHVRRLFDLYVRDYRPVLADRPSLYLFPARQGGVKAEAALAVQVKKTIAHHLGLSLNAHAFRHLAAFLFLRRFPGQYEVVRQLLGHKALTTTVSAYCGAEQAEAVQRYDRLIAESRREEGYPRRDRHREGMHHAA